MCGAWKAGAIEMGGNKRERGERAVVKADKVRNLVLGTTGAVLVSLLFQMAGRDNWEPSSQRGWRTVGVTRSGSRRRPRYG